MVDHGGFLVGLWWRVERSEWMKGWTTGKVYIH